MNVNNKTTTRFPAVVQGETKIVIIVTLPSPARRVHRGRSQCRFALVERGTVRREAPPEAMLEIMLVGDRLRVGNHTERAIRGVAGRAQQLAILRQRPRRAYCGCAEELCGVLSAGSARTLRVVQGCAFAHRRACGSPNCRRTIGSLLRPDTGKRLREIGLNSSRRR